MENWESNQVIQLKLVEKELTEQYQNAWQAELLNKVKLNNYQQIKSVIEADEYVRVNLDKEIRSLISQLLCGVLPLQVETDRYVQITRSKRLCKLCKSSVEDELYFLFECLVLVSKRLELYNKVPESLNFTGTERLKMLCKRPYIFGSYVKELWQTRTTLLRANNCNLTN